MKLIQGKYAHIAHMCIIATVLLFTLYASIDTIATKKSTWWCKVIAGFALSGALILAVDRDTYLPFLYNAVFPSSLVKSVHSPAHANVETVIIVDEPDGTKIAYWGAMPLHQDVHDTPQQAYANYANAGVAEVKNGQATLKFFCPSKYKVNHMYPWATTLERHVHYRVLDSDKYKGMMSPVYTKWVKC